MAAKLPMEDIKPDLEGYTGLGNRLDSRRRKEKERSGDIPMISRNLGTCAAACVGYLEHRSDQIYNLLHYGWRQPPRQVADGMG